MTAISIRLFPIVAAVFLAVCPLGAAQPTNDDQPSPKQRECHDHVSVHSTGEKFVPVAGVLVYRDGRDSERPIIDATFLEQGPFFFVPSRSVEVEIKPDGKFSFLVRLDSRSTTWCENGQYRGSIKVENKTYFIRAPGCETYMFQVDETGELPSFVLVCPGRLEAPRHAS